MMYVVQIGKNKATFTDIEGARVFASKMSEGTSVRIENLWGYLEIWENGKPVGEIK